MALEITLIAGNAADETRWMNELRQALAQVPFEDEVRVSGASQAPVGQIVLVDGSSPAFDALGRIDRAGRAVFLILPENASAPRSWLEGSVDDVLVHPFRPLEVLGRLKRYQQILMWEEVHRLNSSFAGMIDRMRQDVELAERMQKSKLPVRFPDIKGLRAQSRYLAGMKSGGDHFDLAESKDGQQLTMVLTDSSSYGLSSALLSSLMRVTLKLSVDESRSSVETVRRIQEDLAATLGPKDRLSMFYGILNKRDFSLRFLNLGTSCAYYAASGGNFRPLPSQGPAIAQGASLAEAREQELRLEPQDRLVLLSDGFVEVAGGQEGMLALLNRFRSKDAVDALNEMAFQVKSKFTEPDDMPEQDCTALVLDVDSRVIRLAPGTSR